MTETSPGLPFARFNLRLRSEAEGRLPTFLGSTLRGGLAWALRKLVCLPMCRDVSVCLLRERCAYAVCFETQRPEGSERLRSLDRVPHPLVLDVAAKTSESYSPGSALEFGMTLFGRAIEYFPYFVAASARMAEQGLGAGKLRFRLEEVRDRDGTVLWSKDSDRMNPPSAMEIEPMGSPPERAGRMRIEFLTPVRLAEKGRVMDELSFRTLCRSVLGRYSSILYFHAGKELDLDFRGLLETAGMVGMASSSLRKVTLARWSNRQKKKVPLDGLMGAIEFEGDGIAELWPFLKAGEVLHAGKGTVFGLGKYRVEAMGSKTKEGMTIG